MYACCAGTMLFVVPVSILVTVSFFVLVVLQKVTLKNLKNLGLAAVILLWLSAVLICVTGVYRSVVGGKFTCSMMSADKPGPRMGMGNQGMMDESAYPSEMMEMMKNKEKPAPANK